MAVSSWMFLTMRLYKFSYIGFNTQEIVFTGQPSIEVQLVDDTQALDEVVVTALGIKREKKALGYSMSELKVSP